MAVKTVKQKLEQLYALQKIDTRLDQLRAVRGELPLEVTDLEDELTGLRTRLENFKVESQHFDQQIVAKREQIRTSNDLIRKYNEQLKNVKNNREFDALNKEIEIQELTIQAAEKKIGELERSITAKSELIVEVENKIAGRSEDLENKKNELEEITNETEKEEATIIAERQNYEVEIETKLLKAYDKIRNNVRNGVAVAPVMRGACGGCFAKIPAQIQSDIRQSKKIAICENCGRINLDARIAGVEDVIVDETEKPKRRVVRRKV